MSSIGQGSFPKSSTPAPALVVTPSSQLEPKTGAILYFIDEDNNSVSISYFSTFMFEVSPFYTHLLFYFFQSSSAQTSHRPTTYAFGEPVVSEILVSKVTSSQAFRATSPDVVVAPEGPIFHPQVHFLLRLLTFYKPYY